MNRSYPRFFQALRLLILPLALAAFLSLPAAAELELELVVPAAGSPVAVTHANGEVYVTLQDGRVELLQGNSLLSSFLDISDRTEADGERGLLSVAFHPDFAENGYVFAYYTNLAGDVTISRFRVLGSSTVASPGTEKILLTVPEPFANHNGGQLQFGPDGYLYAALGDGGGTNDPMCRAQDMSTLLGKMIRIDVDQNVDTAPYYGIPADNPFVGDDGIPDEIWASGLRNPWRFSFDRQTGDLYIGDVGQSEREEVNFEPAGSAGGRNYGWKMMEGNLCRNQDGGCMTAIPGCDAPAYTPPAFDYDHSAGDCSITGGYVYRGNALPDLVGAYIYGDFCSGRLWAARQVGSEWQTEELAPNARFLTTFGEGPDGEIYLAAGGSLYRLTDPTAPCRAGGSRLCMEEGRFAAEITFRTRQGQTGQGNPVPLTDDSGYFWFFNADNPEIFVKVRNACVPEFNRYWVFSSGLTNVEVTLTVTDTQSGEVRTYESPLREPYPPILDTDAFATCP